MDVYFRPTRLEGVADTNWIQTIARRGFMTAVRLYGTGIEFFEQIWKPDEVARLK